MDYLYQIEDANGIRFSWNIWPGSKADASKNMIPIGCLYTPMKEIPSLPQVKKEPLVCRGTCKSIFNPYCYVDVSTHMWQCCICHQRNAFPQTYHDISATNIPIEKQQTSTTIEYMLKGPKAAPAFLLVVDTCVIPSELQALKDSLLQLLELLPQNSYVGLITYGKHVYVHELSPTTQLFCSRSHVFCGDSEITPLNVHKILGVGSEVKGGRIQANPQNNYIVPLQRSQAILEGIIEDITIDAFPVSKDHRPLRATGAALNIAVALLENTFAGLGGRIMAFMGGATTYGPGRIVGSDLKEAIRTHNELRREAANYTHTATKFYEDLATRVANNSHAVDLFSCSLNQTGLLEMRKLAQDTGGIMILADGFDSPVFQKSLEKIFEKDESGFLKMGFAATMDVFTSATVKPSGCIGPVLALPDRGQNISESPIGIGTNSWRLCTFSPQSTYAVLFEVAGGPKSNAKNGYDASNTQHLVVTQFQTNYQHSSGARIVRVTTIAQVLAPPGAPIKELIPGFDQECAAALIARLAVYKQEKDDTDPLTFLDSQLIKFMKRTCSYTINVPTSLVIPNELSLFSQFMYYFRRGPLINVFNNAPDETVYFRYCLSKECVSNILVMMQPSLDSYTLDEDPQPVYLSANSVLPTNILLLDTFFYIIIHTGATIAQWRNANYHLNPDYENLKELLEMPKEDARNLLENRLPLPVYVECDQYTSQARFLLASVDPVTTHTTPVDPKVSQRIFTEDASLQVFLDKLALVTCKDS